MKKYDVEVIRSNRKTIGIQVTTDGRVIVRAPFYVPTYKIKSLLAEKQDWIEKSLKKMEERSDETEQDDALEKLTETERKLLMENAKRVISARVAYYAPLVGVTYNHVTIRCQKTRWGSCSGKGNLNFNAMLMYVPEEIVDYVVVHELCHRKEMNHSPRFWAEVGKVLPDYKTRRKWLRDHERDLIHKI